MDSQLNHLNIEYDADGDILYLGKARPYAEQISEEIDYGIIARLNPDSREVENVELLFFTKRLAAGEKLELPILAEFHLA